MNWYSAKKYKYNSIFNELTLSYLLFTIVFSSCSVQKNAFDISAKNDLLNQDNLKSAQIGISIFDPATNTFLYNYQGDKYFIPASNTKIFTCYAAMKYLGDSLTAASVSVNGNKILLIPTGDPTFLHPDFIKQPLLNYLNSFDSTKTIYINTNNFQDNAYGNGWSWDDYGEDYMAERSALPLYGNVVKISGAKDNYTVFPSLKGNFISDSTFPDTAKLGIIKRDFGANNFAFTFNTIKDSTFIIPFVTNKSATNISLLQDILKAKLVQTNDADVSKNNFSFIKSQPTDSLLKIMMFRSDDFYAEQALLMVSNQKLGSMNDDLIIEDLLESDFKNLPQRPQWADGSGLSRYNLFTPQDFVFILNKMKNEFTWSRITTIFPQGGQGTLSNRFKNIHGQIFAKTGSLSNNYSLSGYIITQKGKTLIFSIMEGNDMAGGKITRDAVDVFLNDVIDKN